MLIKKNRKRKINFEVALGCTLIKVKKTAKAESKNKTKERVQSVDKVDFVSNLMIQRV